MYIETNNTMPMATWRQQGKLLNPMYCGRVPFRVCIVYSVYCIGFEMKRQNSIKMNFKTAKFKNGEITNRRKQQRISYMENIKKEQRKTTNIGVLELGLLVIYCPNFSLKVQFSIYILKRSRVHNN